MSIADSPSLDQFKQRSSNSSVGRHEYAGNLAISKVGTELDSTLNFRVNSGLKNEFEKLCKLNHSSVARELKRFMTEAVRSQTIL